MDLSAFDLKGKVALITGGAHGIGFSIAEGMAKCGATVCFNCSNEGSLEKGLAAYKAAGIDAHGYVADVTDEAAVNAMIAQIKADVGPVDILVNNAGIVQSGPLEGMSTEEFDAVMATNVRAPFILMRETLPLLKASPSPEIINVCSVVAHEGYPNQSAYVASKHALCGLSKSFANEVFDDGVRVHLISPGGVLTDMVAKVRPEIVGTPMILPEDVADAAEYLLTHRSDAVCDEIRLHRVTKAPF